MRRTNVVQSIEAHPRDDHGASSRRAKQSEYGKRSCHGDIEREPDHTDERAICPKTLVISDTAESTNWFAPRPITITKVAPATEAIVFMRERPAIQ